MLSFLFAVLTRALGFMRYVHYGPFALLGSPVWLNLAWSPAIMMFLYFKPPIRTGFLFWVYLLTFSLLSAMLNEVLHRLGLLAQPHWSSLGRFIVSAFWFYAAALFNERYMNGLHTSGFKTDEGLKP